jgi:thioesterase domain-containing protein
LQELNLNGKIVIQKNVTEYRLPVTDDFIAYCKLDDQTAFNRFLHILKKRGIARINLNSYINSGERIAVAFTGTYIVTTCGL